jgi:hypothetical protein
LHDKKYHWTNGQPVRGRAKEEVRVKSTFHCRSSRMRQKGWGSDPDRFPRIGRRCCLPL